MPGEATERDVAGVARSYFAAMGARDLGRALEHWAPEGVENLPGGTVSIPDGFREFFGGVFAAFPDFRMDVQDIVVQDDKAAVRYRLSGTFAGEPFQGLEPTGARVAVEGCDVLRIRDGLIRRNDAFYDQMELARQLGALPAAGSAQERGLTAVVNLRTRAARRAMTSEPERIADGVWVIRGGIPRSMNVYLIEGSDGVTVFDAGIKGMGAAIAAAGARLGGISRVVLGHGHPDHRGAAPAIGAPVHCHPDEVADTEGDGGTHYFEMSRLDPWGRVLLGSMLPIWDGGPVNVAGTVVEGDEVAGFRVVHLPGHAPGLIGLWREDDRLALVSDCFYTLDPQTGVHGGPRVAHRAFNLDTDQARASIRKLAEMEPAAAWAGHAEPVTGDVRAQLEHAAATT